jgi:hypothetical protein
MQVGLWHLVCLAGLLCAPSVQAHVYATKTLHGLVAEADLVLRSRIVAARPQQTSSSTPPGANRPSVEASVLEVLKGDFDEPLVRFAQHGHGVAHFDPGDETLLFLTRIERNRELDALAASGAFRWVSLQEHRDEYPLVPATRGHVLAAVRGYVAASAASSPEQQLAFVRRATLELLESRDPKLAGSALRDLAAAPGLPLATQDELEQLLAIERDPNVSMGIRVALLGELGRRGLVDPTPYWLSLLSDDVSVRDRITAIRAAGLAGSPAVQKRLIALLGDPNERIAAAAAVALGMPDNGQAVAPLATALSAHTSEAVRLAAIRGLGRIGSPEARSALEQAAESHLDAATQRRARAELRKPRSTTASPPSAE